MEKECEAIKANALRFSWHMRGGATYEDVLNMSQAEHTVIAKMIEENMKTTSETQLPYF
jgi:hypothetical protein